MHRKHRDEQESGEVEMRSWLKQAAVAGEIKRDSSREVTFLDALSLPTI